MTQIHTSYKVSKMLKEFLGESAPEPIDGAYHYGTDEYPEGPWKDVEEDYYTQGRMHSPKKLCPAYQLHDLLSNPFCEAVSDKTEDMGVWEISESLNMEYFNGGLPAVEKALCEMMEAKP